MQPVAAQSFIIMKSDLQQENIKKQIFNQLLKDNPTLESILLNTKEPQQVHDAIRKMALEILEENPVAKDYYLMKNTGREQFDQLSWKDFAAIRILDYIDRNGLEVTDLNLRGEKVTSEPFIWLWEAARGSLTDISPEFLLDMSRLFKQLKGDTERKMPTREEVLKWMDMNPSGLDAEMVEIRRQNKDRIIRKFIELMDSGKKKDAKYQFEEGWSDEDKFSAMMKWWDERLFHLRFAIRDPELLNSMLDNSLSEETMSVLRDAKQAGIPTFVNPYYISLLHVKEPDHLKGTDEAIREYILYSSDLVNEFGQIVAWEKEDIVEEGKPNAAGWLLPGGHNIHRRYPEVSILIPDTMGRACGGLCSSCQRMYDFQNGNLNFNLDKLQPKEKWPAKLTRLMRYFEEDSQLRDILITGGDALMSTDRSLQSILDAVYQMAYNKKEKNKERAEGEKYAEILRIRLGTRLPVYLPQRITPELIQILEDFKKKASAIGVRQFVIQTHFETAMEVTPEARKGIEGLLSAGWIITNQQVFTTGASKRGHTAKLRKVLNDAGVLPYYTFTVKGYCENSYNFATNERAVQEQIEEKRLGLVPRQFYEEIKSFPDDPENITANINKLRDKANLPFLATDRNVLNLPGVGKSLTFRTIGITKDGRRILEFDHDHTRRHSPIIQKLGKIIIVESKSIARYLHQMKEMGEDIGDYIDIFGYSIGETEPIIPIYRYPDYQYKVTEEFSNLYIHQG